MRLPCPWHLYRDEKSHFLYVRCQSLSKCMQMLRSRILVGLDALCSAILEVQ